MVSNKRMDKKNKPCRNNSDPKSIDQLTIEERIAMHTESFCISRKLFDPGNLSTCEKAQLRISAFTEVH